MNRIAIDGIGEYTVVAVFPTDVQMFMGEEDIGNHAAAQERSPFRELSENRSQMIDSIRYNEGIVTVLE